MTPAQLATFKTAILADNSLAADRTAGNHGVIADYYNTTTTGSVYKPRIEVAELCAAIDWSEYATLTVALQNTYMAMTQGGYLDATIARVRNGFATVFANGSASRTNLLAIAARAPTRFEAVFAVSNVTPVFGQQVSVADIVLALAP